MGEGVLIVPQPLYLCPLRVGGADLLAHVVVSPGVAEIGWVVRGRGIELAGRRVVGSNGRARIACVVPGDVEAVTLTVDGGGSEAIVEACRFQQGVALRLPLDGQALVVVGHGLGEVHRSAWEIPSQGFAWDLVPLSGDRLALLSQPWAGEALPAASFAAFGAPVLAPADGTVVGIVDGEHDLATVGELPDPDPFRDDPALAAGNHVVIDHGEAIFSLLAHLQQGSVRVDPGEVVTVGQQVAALGNSGFSSGPHLHFHCMTGPSLTDAAPLPVALDVEGTRLDPHAGEIVASG